MPNSSRKTIFTTISIDKETAALVEKICKRYSLKKSEVVKLAFGYIDKTHINPSEAPESVKSELAKINKRQDDIIRFIRHYEEEQLNPMIRATNSITLRFDAIGKTLEKYEDTSGSGERKAKVRVTYYDSNNTSSTIGQFEFPVAQQSAIKISDDLYMERYEESNMWLQPGIHEHLQAGNAADMQWGYSGQVLYGNQDRYTNGKYLTANAVYNHVKTRNGIDAPNWETPTYDKYRVKYPLTGDPITEPATGVETESVYYYPVLTAKPARTTFFDPIYNSSAARYCHEKNRDANGNGVIDADEAVWYLPSLADMIYIREKWSSDINMYSHYWTSSEEDNGNSWSYDHYGNAGSKSTTKTSRLRVRCIKGKGAVSLPEPALYSSDDKDNSKIDFKHSEGHHYIYIKDKTGLPWTVTSSNTQWLKFRRSIGGGDIFDSIEGSGDAANRVVYALSNPSQTDRTATITLTRRDTPNSKVITVTQAGYVPPPAATVNKTKIELDFLDEEPIVFSVDNKGTGIQWTVNSNQSWLKLVQYPIGGSRESSFSSTGNVSIYATATSRNPGTSARTGTLTLSRAQMANITITVTQKPTLPYTPIKAGAGDWAGSNIYWNSIAKRLEFDDVGVRTHENYQGLAFYWGSLVAMSPKYPYTTSDLVVFAPVSVQNPNSIPKATTTSKNADPLRHHVLEQHDPQNNIGDICRYMTKKGWAPGYTAGKKWRLPTCADFQDRGLGTSPTDYSLYSYQNLDKQGRSEIPKGRIQLTQNVYLPASGWLFEVLQNANTGGWWVGYSGTYWSGTGSDVGWPIMYQFNGQLNQSGTIGGRSIQYPCVVRCVLDKN